jgi:lysophospholipase L1-like esterase
MKCASDDISATKTRGGSGRLPLVVVAFGDSTTAPRSGVGVFSSLVEHRFKLRARTVRVINSGVPGDTTARAIERFKRDVLVHNPDVVTIQFGINDSAVDVFHGAVRPRVSLCEYERNLVWMVDALTARKTRLVLLTPNPVAWTDELRAIYNKPPYRTSEPDGWNTLLKDYASAVRRVAHARHVPLIDVYQLFQCYSTGRERDLSDLMLDGMHPNNEAHSMIAEELVKVLPKLLASDCKK